MDIKPYRVGRLDLLAWRLVVARPMNCAQWARYVIAFNVRAKIAASKQRGQMAEHHRQAADLIEWMNPQAALSLRRAARNCDRYPTPDSAHRTHQTPPNDRRAP